jgi:hypothetical protein
MVFIIVVTVQLALLSLSKIVIASVVIVVAIVVVALVAAAYANVSFIPALRAISCWRWGTFPRRSRGQCFCWQCQGGRQYALRA